MEERGARGCRDANIEAGLGGGSHTQSTRDLIRLTRHEHVHPIMLAREFPKELVFEFRKRDILVAGYDDGRRLVSCGVHLDVVLQRVVVDVICRGKNQLAIVSKETKQNSR